MLAVLVVVAVATQDVACLVDGSHEVGMIVGDISQYIEDASNPIAVKQGEEILGGFKETAVLLPPLGAWNQRRIVFLKVTGEQDA